MLSNMTLGILILLLLILIFVVYYVWNDSKKNRNQIMILESDVASLRETVGDLQKKVDDVMGHGGERRQEGSENRMADTSDILQSFMNQLNLGDLMNQGYFEDEDEEEDEEEGSGEEDSSEEEYSDEEEESLEEESGEEESGEEESGEEESAEEGSVVEEEKSSLGEPVEDLVEEPVVVEEVPVITEEVKATAMDSLAQMEFTYTGKKPSTDPSSFDEGYIQKGGDGKEYMVSRNKKGVPFWKIYKA